MTAGLDFGALMNASALLFSAFGLALVFLARDIDDWPKGLSVAILSSAAVCSALELLDHAVADTGVSPTLLLVLRNVEVVTAALPSLLMFAYFLYCCGEDYKKSAVMRIQVALTCTLVAAEFLAQPTGEISSAPAAETRLGPWIVLFLALNFATTVVCLVALFRKVEEAVRRAARHVLDHVFAFLFRDGLHRNRLFGIPSVKRPRAPLPRAEGGGGPAAGAHRRPADEAPLHPQHADEHLLPVPKDPRKEAQQAILNFSATCRTQFRLSREPFPSQEELEHAKRTSRWSKAVTGPAARGDRHTCHVLPTTHLMTMLSIPAPSDNRFSLYKLLVS